MCKIGLMTSRKDILETFWIPWVPSGSLRDTLDFLGVLCLLYNHMDDFIILLTLSAAQRCLLTTSVDLEVPADNVISLLLFSFRYR
jgi:hypothetical protein